VLVMLAVVAASGGELRLVRRPTTMSRATAKSASIRIELLKHC
jgi:hypothetical protein